MILERLGNPVKESADSKKTAWNTRASTTPPSRLFGTSVGWGEHCCHSRAARRQPSRLPRHRCPPTLQWGETTLPYHIEYSPDAEDHLRALTAW